MLQREFYNLSKGDRIFNRTVGEIVEITSIQKDWLRERYPDGPIVFTPQGKRTQVTWAVETQPYYYIKVYDDLSHWGMVEPQEYPSTPDYEPTPLDEPEAYSFHFVDGQAMIVRIALMFFRDKWQAADMLTPRAHEYIENALAQFEAVRPMMDIAADHIDDDEENITTFSVDEEQFRMLADAFDEYTASRWDHMTTASKKIAQVILYSLGLADTFELTED